MASPLMAPPGAGDADDARPLPIRGGKPRRQQHEARARAQEIGGSGGSRWNPLYAYRGPTQLDRLL